MAEEKEPKKKNKKLKVLKWIALGLLAVILVVAGFFASKLLALKAEAEALVAAKGPDVFRENQTSIVYDCNGNQIATFCGDKNLYYLEFDEIPFMVKEIFLVTEDKNFYEHSGVDYKAVLRATVALIENNGEITQGGSTITQQLAKNTYLTYNDISYTRKIKEMFIAWKLEDLYTKDQILEFYINDIYFGNGLYGVQAAAKGYFNKNASDLSLSEMCFVCAIPNNPALYDPLTNMENTIKRRDRILAQLLQEKVINGSDYEEALAENITLSLGDDVNINYVETFVKYAATRELMELNGFEFQYYFTSDIEKKNYTEKYNEAYGEYNSLLFTGGYEIYTSIDMEKQELLQKVMDDQLLYRSDEITDDGIYALQGSAVCIDNATGFVVAIVGGREQETSGYTLNRAYQSFRQPGSAIKPVLVYAPLFETGYTPDSIVVDAPVEGGPQNYDGMYMGEIDIKTALAYSRNTVAWNMFNELGASKCLSYLLNMQFSHIVKEDYNSSSAIGGLTYGTSALEMAAAYATLENDGYYRKPTCIEKIYDSYGNEIVNNTDSGEIMIYDETAARMTTEAIRCVLTFGTGRGYNPTNAVCAAKTGTTNDDKDAWIAGYSKYYTTAVWCGYDIPQNMTELEKSGAGMTWRTFMENIHKELDEQDFEGVSVKETDTDKTDDLNDNSGNNHEGGYVYTPEEGEGGLYHDGDTYDEQEETSTYMPEDEEGGLYHYGDTYDEQEETGTYVPEDEGLYVN